VQVASQDGLTCCQIAKTGGDDRVRIVDNLTANVSVGVITCMIWHDDSAFGLNLAASDGTYLIDMVWWDGDITSTPDGAYLSNYTLDTWIDVIIYYNLTQGWMFSLDGQLYGVNYSIPLSNPYTGNATQMIWSSFFSGGGNGNMYVTNIGYDFTGVEPIPTVGEAYPFVRPNGTGGDTGNQGGSNDDNYDTNNPVFSWDDILTLVIPAYAAIGVLIVYLVVKNYQEKTSAAAKSLRRKEGFREVVAAPGAASTAPSQSHPSPKVRFCASCGFRIPSKQYKYCPVCGTPTK
jgi:hypothetical protein